MQIKLTAITPTRFNLQDFRTELIKGMEDVGELIRDNFEDTTKTWNHQPVFEPNPNTPRVTPDKIEVSTLTEDKIYGWVAKGTKGPYPIVAKNVPRLRYPDTFVPKTFPGIIGSGQGFSGPPIKRPVAVQHPGVEARDFDKNIKDTVEKDLKTRFPNMISLAIKASGHAYP